MTKEKIILGIDPGTLVLGYGLLSIKGSSLNALCIGEIQLKKFDNHQLKLKHIYERITNIIENYLPDECAVESPFYGENVQSMLKLGRAQGVAMVACLNKGLPVEEYYPKKVKLSITGNGNASKEQVAEMLKKLCNLQRLPKSLDSTDALAVAVCHYFQNSVSSTNKTNFSSWKSFVSSNKDKIIKK